MSASMLSLMLVFALGPPSAAVVIAEPDAPGAYSWDAAGSMLDSGVTGAQSAADTTIIPVQIRLTASR